MNTVGEIQAALAELVKALPSGRRRSIALTQLEQASMWAVKAAVGGDNE